MKKIILIFLLFFAILLGFSSCYNIQEIAETITIESGEIPSDMAVEDFVIIGVLKENKNYDKWLAKSFEVYTGDYILLTEKEIENNEIYRDVSKYRYIFDYDFKTVRNKDYRAPSTRMPGESDFHERDYIKYTYFIYDRQDSGKTYVRKSGSGYYGKEIKVYLTAIDLIRYK